MIQVKNRDVLGALLAWIYHSKLRQLIYWILSWCDQELVITEGYRIRLHPNDVHSTKPVRAIDIRAFNPYDSQEFADKINKHWIYDPERPEMKCCVYGDEKHKDHFHLQVHARTKFIL